MVHETGAKSTDLQSPESVEHLTDKCQEYAKDWAPKAEEIWNKKHFVPHGYLNYKPKDEVREA